MIIRARRFIAAGALAVAAVAAPIASSFVSASAGQLDAGGKCLAWYGNQEDGVCLGYSNGQPIVGATPGGLYGPSNSSGFGSSSAGGLAPGTTFTSPAG
jgi:hypothetical protein